MALAHDEVKDVKYQEEHDEEAYSAELVSVTEARIGMMFRALSRALIHS